MRLKGFLMNLALRTLRFLNFAVLVMYSVSASAAGGSGKLSSGLQAGYDEIHGAWSVISKLMYVVAGVVAFIGAIKVYGKWTEGAPDTSKTAGLWFGGAAFFIVANIIIENVFVNA